MTNTCIGYSLQVTGNNLQFKVPKTNTSDSNRYMIIIGSIARNKCQANSDLSFHMHILPYFIDRIFLKHVNRWLDLERFASSSKTRFYPDGLASFSANIVPLPYGQENLWQQKLCSASYCSTDNV